MRLNVSGSILFEQKRKKKSMKGLVSVQFYFTSKDPLTLSLICIKSQAVDRSSTLEHFDQTSQYISVKIPLHKQSEYL